MPLPPAPRRASSSFEAGLAAMKRGWSILGITAVLGVAGALFLDGTDARFGLGRSTLEQFVTDEPYRLSDLALFDLAMTKVTNEYLDPTGVDPKKMLHAGLDALAQRVPEFRWSEQGTEVELALGTQVHRVPEGSLDSVAALVQCLRPIAAWLDTQLPPERTGEEDDPYARRHAEYALLNAVLGTLDPHSVFLPPAAHEEWSIQARGHFGGLGITIGIRDERLTVLYPLEGTPAWRAGLKPGDRIDRIGPESTINMEIDEAVSKLRGEIDTDVTIAISDDAGMEKELTLQRARIEVKVVKYALAKDGVGLVTITNFGETTSNDVHDALEKMSAEARTAGHDGLKGLVLDLRGNPGGYLKEAVTLSDLFLSKGVIVSTVGLGDVRIDEQRARGADTWGNLPIAVLVDGSSASASEIVAGALQNNDRAVVLGVRTFGKGSVQNLYDREFGEGALKLTVAQYKTPGDRVIQGVGIEPDFVLREAQVREKDGERQVALYWEDFQMREEDLEHAFSWGGKKGEQEVPSWIYLCTDCGGDEERKSEETAKEHLEDPPVLAARELLVRASSTKRAELVRAGRPLLDQWFAARTAELGRRLAEFGIDWSPPPSSSKGDPAMIDATLTVDGPDGMIVPGKATPVTLSVTNRGPVAVHRLRAVLEGDLFEGREFVIGKVAPGETRSWTVPFRLLSWYWPTVDEVEVKFLSEGSSPPPSLRTRVLVRPVPHPQFAFSWQVIDDGREGSRGNGDGLAQPGELLALQVRVRNAGEGPTSDIWRAEQGIADPSPVAGKTPRKRLGGQVVIKNGAQEALQLKKGNDEFSLRPGEEAVRVLLMQVASDVGGRSVLPTQLMVGDDKFGEWLVKDLDLPVFPAVQEVGAAAPRLMVGKKGPVELLGAADAGATPVAVADGPFEIDGRCGGWFRVQAPWGAPLWAASADIEAAPRTAQPGPIRGTFAYAPPTLQLTEAVAGTVTSASTLRVSGKAHDDEGLRDVMVFVQGRKVAYQQVAAGQKDLSFAFELPLKEKGSRIEVVARDADDLRTARTFGVYRQHETAQAR